MINILAVGLGGFVGAVGRYLIGLIPMSETMTFPIKTFGINVLGCLIIGILALSAAKGANASPQMMLFLKVGVCGGFTTFSTFALETAELIRAGSIGVALTYVIASVLVGIGVIFAVEYLS